MILAECLFPFGSAATVALWLAVAVYLGYLYGRRLPRQAPEDPAAYRTWARRPPRTGLLAMSVILIACLAVLIVAVIDPTVVCEGRGRFGWAALLFAPFGVTFLTIGMPTMVRLTLRDRGLRRRQDA